jgi:hypothetical protein
MSVASTNLGKCMCLSMGNQSVTAEACEIWKPCVLCWSVCLALILLNLPLSPLADYLDIYLGSKTILLHHKPYENYDLKD